MSKTTGYDVLARAKQKKSLNLKSWKKFAKALDEIFPRDVLKGSRGKFYPIRNAEIFKAWLGLYLTARDANLEAERIKTLFKRLNRDLRFVEDALYSRGLSFPKDINSFRETLHSLEVKLQAPPQWNSDKALKADIKRLCLLHIPEAPPSDLARHIVKILDLAGIPAKENTLRLWIAKKKQPSS